MSNKKDDQTSENGAAQAAQAAPTRFSVESLRQSSRKLFGVTTSTFDGATYGLTQKEFTVEEMATHIKKWQGTPVRPVKKIKKEGN